MAQAPRAKLAPTSKMPAHSTLKYTKPKPRWDVHIEEGQENYRFRFAGGLEAFAVAPQPDLNHTEHVESTLASV